MRLRNTRKNAKEIERERYCKDEAGNRRGKKKERAIKNIKNIYVYIYNCINVPGSFYEQARKAVNYAVRSNKISGKPATLPPLAQMEREKEGRMFDPESFIVASAFALLHNIVKIYLFSISRKCHYHHDHYIVIIIIIINIDLN